MTSDPTKVIAQAYAALYEGDASARDAAMLACREHLLAAGEWGRFEVAVGKLRDESSESYPSTARELVQAAFQRTTTRGGDGFLSNLLTLVFGQRIHAWFAGENDKVRVWEFFVPPALGGDFAELTGAEFQRHVEHQGDDVYRVRVEQLAA